MSSTPIFDQLVEQLAVKLEYQVPATPPQPAAEKAPAATAPEPQEAPRRRRHAE
ncbi:hypothetical protein [Solihabitans fulvus]|uniref:hypothetical protein n=1 Tax=Solihabitans fulvus TaxID=1892852 RepID=UPI001661AA54|nr:hypothetical protein [Solihabitans fulvus]